MADGDEYGRGVSLATPPRDQERGTHVPGEEGVWVLIFGDMVLFAVIFATFLFYRSQDPVLFADGQRHLNVGIGVLNTVVLLTSSLLVVTGIRAIRHGAARLAPPMFAGALICGVIFGIDKYVEYSAEIANGHTPASGNFFMFYFVLTGLHMFHVLIGMGVLTFMINQARKVELSGRQVGYVESGACFWHLVDLIWIVLFPLVYLVRT